MLFHNGATGKYSGDFREAELQELTARKGVGVFIVIYSIGASIQRT